MASVVPSTHLDQEVIYARRCMTHPLTEDDLLTNTVLFCRALRERDLLVTPSEAIDAVTTLNLIDLYDRQETFLSLRSVLTSRVEDLPVCEELFDGFWSRLGQSQAPRKIGARADLTRSLQRFRLPTHGGSEKGLAFFLEDWGVAESRATEPINSPGASNVESTGEKDFSLFGADELEEISRLARRIARRLARSASRRWKPV